MRSIWKQLLERGHDECHYFNASYEEMRGLFLFPLVLGANVSALRFFLDFVTVTSVAFLTTVLVRDEVFVATFSFFSTAAFVVTSLVAFFAFFSGFVAADAFATA